MQSTIWTRCAVGPFVMGVAHPSSPSSHNLSTVRVWCAAGSRHDLPAIEARFPGNLAAQPPNAVWRPSH
jgi:hypothetical protein